MQPFGGWASPRDGARGPPYRGERGFLVSDLVYIALIVGFFVVSALYVRFCDKV